MEMQKKSWLFVGIGAVALLLGAFYSVGFHHPDEHFQIIEFALQKMGRIHARELPWEFNEKMRPALQPILAIAGIRFCELLGWSSPFAIATFFRLVSVALSFFAMWNLYHLLKGEFASEVEGEVAGEVAIGNLQTKGQLKQKGANAFANDNSSLGSGYLERYGLWFVALSFTLWFWVYAGIRFSSENWSAGFFILGFVGVLRALARTRSSDAVDYFKLLLLIGGGLALGLAYVFRFQLVLMVGGFLGWLLIVKRVPLKQLALVVIGVVLGVGLGTLADRWFYGEWVNTFWNYFVQNIVQHKAAHFGVYPWYFFIVEFFNRAIPPFSALLIVAIVWAFFKLWKHPVVWCVLPFLLVHFIIGHKEVRFLFPAFAFFPFLVVKGFALLDQGLHGKLGVWLSSKIGKWLVRLFVLSNLVALLGAVLKPAMERMGLYAAVYHYAQRPQQHSSGEGLNLYYFERNPYQEMDMYQHFYAPANLCCIQVAREAVRLNNPELPHGLVVFESGNLPDLQWRNQHQYQLVYCSLPEWVTAFDFNGWVERSEGYWVYEVGGG